MTETNPSNHPVEPVVSESAYLNREADDARAAVFKTIAEIKAQAKALAGNTVDPRNLTRAHPYIALGSAVTTGFVAALLAVPSKRQQRMKVRADWYKLRHPAPPPAPTTPSNGSSPAPAAPPQTIWQSLIHEAISLVKPVLVAAITAGLRPGVPDEDPLERRNNSQL